MSARVAEHRRESPPSGRPWRLLLQLAALSGFAVAQPLYDILARNGEFFVAHQARPGDILALVALLSLGLPLVWLGVSWPIGRLLGGSGAAAAAPVAGLLLGLTALAPLHRLGGLPAVAALALAAVVAVVGGWWFGRGKGLRPVLMALSPAAVLFPLWFLLGTPVATLLRAPAAGAVGFDVPRIESSTPVVMVVFDEMSLVSLTDSQGEIRRAQFPNFAALVDTAYWFRNATTVGENTAASVPALLSGRLPADGALPTAADHPHNLFALLAAGGYGLRVFEWQTSLCALADCADRSPTGSLGSRLAAMTSDLAIVYAHWTLPAELTASLPAVDASWRGFARAPVEPDGAAEFSRSRHPVDYFDRFLDAVGTGQPSTFYFVHLGLPHVPWKFLPSGSEYGPMNLPVVPHGGEGGAWTDDIWQVRQSYQRHLLQVGLVDRLVGRLRERLEAVGLFDESLIVIVADHGLAFVSGESRRELAEENVDEITNVPMFVKLPGQTEGVVSERNVETTDLVPTIAEVLGVKSPWAVDGASVLDGAPPPRGQAKIVRGKEIPPGGFSYSIEALVADRRRSLDLAAALLGNPGSWDEVLAIGPAIEEVGGRAVGAEVEVIERPDWSVDVTLDQPEQWSSVDPEGPFVPAHVTGRLEGVSSKTRRPLAVVVNGVVEATTWSYALPGGDVRFSAMVGQDAFAPGPNRVEIYGLDLGEGPARLVPLRRAAGVSYRLSGGAAGGSLVASDGRRLPIGPPAERTRARIHPGQLGALVRGHLRPGAGGVVPEALVATLRAEPLFAAPFDEVRRARPPGYEGQLVHFEIRLPEYVSREASELALFLVFDDHAEPVTVD